MKILLSVLFLFMFSVQLLAQPGLPPPDPGPVPIQGLGYLLLAGAALGIKKIMDIQKRQNH